MSYETEHGGPAFPIPSSDWQAHGLSKRELFAAILMHSEAVTCGVPGEACDALVEASREAGTDVIDHMALNAVQGADALLRALNGPLPVQYRELYTSEQMQLKAADRLANLINAIKDRPEYAALPIQQREAIESAIDEVLDPEIPF